MSKRHTDDYSNSDKDRDGHLCVSKYEHGILISKACFECAELLIVRLLDLPEQMTLTLIDWEFFSSFRAQHYREL